MRRYTLAVVVGAAFAWLGLPGIAGAASTPGTEQAAVGFIGGDITDYAVRGNFAYVGEGTSLVVVDASIPESPRRRGMLVLPSAITQLALDSPAGLAMLCGNELLTVDVSNADAPALRGRVELPRGGDVLAVSGDFAFVGPSGITVVGLAPRETPRVLSTIDSVPSDQLVVSGNLLLGIGNESVQLFDSSDPAALAELKTWSGRFPPGMIAANGVFYSRSDLPYINAICALDTSTGNCAPITRDEFLNTQALYGQGGALWSITPENIYKFTISGPTELALAGKTSQALFGSTTNDTTWSRVLRMSDSLAVVLLTDFSKAPSPPFSRYLAMYRNPGANTLTFAGRYRSLRSPVSVATTPGYAYLADVGEGAIQVVDVRIPAAPRRVNTVRTSGTAERIVVEGGRAVVADGFAGISIFGVSNPDVPDLKAVFKTSIDARDVAVVGNLALVTQWNTITSDSGLAIVDLSDSSAPVLRGSVNFPGRFAVRNARALRVVASGSIAAVTVDQGDADNPNGYTRIVDFSDPAAPRQIRVLDGAAVGAMAANGGRLYHFSGSPTSMAVTVLDAANPLGPIQTGSYEDAPFGSNVITAAAVDGQRAIVASNGRLTVFDLSTVSAPRALASFTNPQNTSGLVVNGANVFVAEGNDGFGIYTFSVTATPTPTSTPVTPTATALPSQTPIGPTLSPTNTPVPSPTNLRIDCPETRSFILGRPGFPAVSDQNGDGVVDATDYNWCMAYQVLPTPTRSATPSLTPSLSPTASSSPSVSPTGSPTASPSFSATASPSQSPTHSPTASPSASVSLTATASPSVSPTGSPTASPSFSATASPSQSPTRSPTASPSATPSPTGLLPAAFRGTWVRYGPEVNCDGPASISEIAWTELAYDESAWVPTTLPYSASTPSQSDLYFRCRFPYSGTEPFHLTWASDDGSRVYINGSLFSQLGLGCHEGGCVGELICGGSDFSTNPQPGYPDISSLLVQGENVIAVHVTNGGSAGFSDGTHFDSRFFSAAPLVTPSPSATASSTPLP